MQKITPCLWFDGNAEAAAQFYVSVFRNGRIVETMRYGDAGPGPKGGVMAVRFEIEGESFTALNGGPQFTFSPAISFFVGCADQDEIDALWDKLLDGGTAMQCGWVTDRFGVTWQIVPRKWIDLIQDSDPERYARVMRAMMGMVKLDIAALQAAYDGV